MEKVMGVHYNPTMTITFAKIVEPVHIALFCQLQNLNLYLDAGTQMNISLT